MIDDDKNNNIKRRKNGSEYLVSARRYVERGIKKNAKTIR